MTPPPRRQASSEQVSEPPPRRQAPAQADPEQEAETPPPPPPRRGGGAPLGQGVDENEDNVPEEARDPAPPVKEKVEDAPPQVAATGPAPARSASGDLQLRDRLSRLTKLNR